MMLADVTATVESGATVAMLVILAAGQITIWITLKSSQRREVSFLGDPLEKSMFDEHERMQRENDFKIWHQRELDKDAWKEAACEIREDIGALKKDAELTNQRIVSFDNKLDRLLGDK